jgi:hypothetical protein
MKKKILLILSSITIGFTSCVELEADIAIPDVPSQLVLSAYLSPNDTMTRVYLSQTSPTLGQLVESQVNDALVVLSNRFYADTLMYNPLENAFTSTRPIMPAEEYQIWVRDAKGREIIARTNVVPAAPLSLAISWIDSSLFANPIFRVDAELNYLTVDTVTGIVNFFSQEMKPSSSEIITSIGPMARYEIIYTSTKVPSIEEKFIEINLLHINQDYYNFELSLKDISGYSFVPSTKVYTNVKNGYGIFASHNNNSAQYLNFR